MMNASALTVGQSAHFTKVIDEAAVQSFADASGDYNPLHMDEDAAAKGFFKKRIAHGMLTAGVISAAIASRLPGEGSIYLSQQLRFIAPVAIGDELSVTLTITAIDDKRKRITLTTDAHVGDTQVASGEAVIFFPQLNGG